MSETVYLKLEKISMVREKTVYLNQVGKLWCSNKELEKRCGDLYGLFCTGGIEHPGREENRRVYYQMTGERN